MVAKTDDEIYVLSIIKICSFHLLSLLWQRRPSCWNYWKWCSYFENPYHHAKIVDKKGIIFLVGPYCTLLFSKKETTKFSEVALMSSHWNKNDNKNTEAKCNVCSNLFYWSFGYPKANFGPSARRHPLSPNVNDNYLSSTSQRSLEASYWGWFPKPDEAHQWDSSHKPFDSECNVLSHWESPC